MSKAFFHLLSACCNCLLSKLNLSQAKLLLRTAYCLLPTANRQLLLLLPTATAFCLLSCGTQSTPLDSDTRIRIDSIANAQIAKAQIEHDSMCKAAQITQLPHLIDSIKQIRLREIEEQLKSVPK